MDLNKDAFPVTLHQALCHADLSECPDGCSATPIPKMQALWEAQEYGVDTKDEDKAFLKILREKWGITLSVKGKVRIMGWAEWVEYDDRNYQIASWIPFAAGASREFLVALSKTMARASRKLLTGDDGWKDADPYEDD